MIRLAELLSDEYQVFTYGQEKYFTEYENENIHICNNIEKCIENSKIIISGIPLSKDNVTIDCLYSEKVIGLNEVFTKMENKTFIAGVIPIQFYENKTIKIVDLMKSEKLTILNAISTVEGTIKIAIEETEDTIHESNVLIMGYGRIGKILCKDFKMLGANVYCTARKEDDLTWIREERNIPVTYNELEDYASNIDIIINTVPCIIIEEKIIKKLKKDCLIIDIASQPGGVDKNVEKMYKIKIITAQGIPGKIAPKKSAKYIKEILKDIEGV